MVLINQTQARSAMLRVLDCLDDILFEKRFRVLTVMPHWPCAFAL